MRTNILNTSAELVGAVDESYETFQWTRRLWAPNTFRMTINRRRLYASEIEKGRLLHLPDEDDLVFMIEHIETYEDAGRDKDLLVVAGRSLEGIATVERLAIPPAGQSHDSQTSVAAETAIKHYVDEHAGPSADADRQVPGLSIATDQARGATVSVQARYQSVADIIAEIGVATGMGWQINFDPSTGLYEFEVIVGTDRSASVFFDVDFQSLSGYSELSSLLDSKTHAVVAGQGEGADREVVERFLGSEKTGLDRREVFVDARDIEEGATDALETRGDSVLEGLTSEERFEATVHQYGSFRYREHWDLGDIVLVRDAARGIARASRVVAVNSEVSGSKVPTRTVELDRPWPTMKERVKGGTGSSVSPRGAVDAGGSGVPAGVIVMWSGTIASIPTGWLLCDGNNGTPDLRDRFIVGEGTTPGGSGGTVSPAGALGGHSNHVVTQPSAHGSHTHRLPFGDNGTANMGWTTGGFGHSGSLSITGIVSFAAAGGAVSAMLSEGTGAGSHTGTAVDAHSAHGVYKYFKLAFLMKA